MEPDGGCWFVFLVSRNRMRFPSTPFSSLKSRWSDSPVPKGTWWTLALAALVVPVSAEAVPSFARQMNMACIACHTDYPELTAFGRQFKLGGYTMSLDQTKLPPVAVMLQPSFTHTRVAQAGGAAPGFGDNNNTALTQASIFYAGRLFGPYAKALFGPELATFLNKIGVFSQTTYDGVGKAWSWDNTEVRYADAGTLAGQSATYGFYANNNPTMQDPWNSTPAWGFPFSGSGLAPGPAAATLIDGGLAQTVAGAGAYAMLSNSLYLDIAGYHTFGAHLQKQLGVDPAGEAQVSGFAPYWRVAWTQPAGNGTWEVGTFGMAADTYPGRDASAGQDRIVDIGLDSEYQVAVAKDDLTAMMSWTHERQDWSASQVLGNTTNLADTLRNLKVTLDWLHDKTYGLSAQVFTIGGSADALLYPDGLNGSPDSNGFILQANYMPLNKGGGPEAWPRSNVKFSAQYVAYTKFDGTRDHARDNNTLYLEAWVAF